MEKHNAFTLAETLITLAILGLVAALTIPNLVHKFQDRMTITKFKKVYSLLNNAIQQMYVLEGAPEKWDWPQESNWRSNARYYSTKLKKYVRESKTPFFNTSDKFLKGTSTSNPGQHSYEGGMVLNDGTHLSFYIVYKRASHATSFTDLTSRAAPDEAGKFIGYITIDLNGKKGPNRYGYDVFELRVLEDGLGFKYGYNINSSNCNISNSSSMGDTCAYWILKHNNMDYKYRNVSAEW